MDMDGKFHIHGGPEKVLEYYVEKNSIMTDYYYSNIM